MGYRSQVRKNAKADSKSCLPDRIDVHVARIKFQFGSSLNPRPLRIIGTHFSALVALVWASFALEMWKMYDFLRPGVSASKAVLRIESLFSLLCNSPGIENSEGFFSSTFFPDSSNAMAS